MNINESGNVVDMDQNIVSALLDGLSREYHTVWLIGGADRRMRLYRSTGRSTLKAAVQLGLDLKDYDTAMYEYSRTMIHEDDRDRAWSEFRFSTLEKKVPDVGIYVTTYRRYIGNGQIVHAGNESTGIIVGSAYYRDPLFAVSIIGY